MSKRSLTETAKAVLLNEDPTPNSATLKPGATAMDPPKKIDGEVQDLGPALVTPDGESGPAKAAQGLGKDKSKSAKSSVPAEKIHEEDEDNLEISEELEAFIKEKIEAGLSEEEIAKAIEENFEIVSEEAEQPKEDAPVSEETAEEDGETKDEEEIAEDAEPEQIPIDVTEDVAALLSGEDLSEEFKEKAKTIFEAAVQSRVGIEVKKLEEAFVDTLNEQVESIQTKLAEEIDDYIGYVVEQWINDNQVAIESGLRSELTEDFINGMRNLFAENFIDVPEEKIDVVEELATKLETVEGKLNEEIEKNVGLTKTLHESKQHEILASASEGLTDTQVEKLKSLAEGVGFITEDDYSKKIETLKESYFSKAVKKDQVIDKVEPGDGKGIITENLEGSMKRYVQTLGRKLPN
jgi:hypothetical protein